jgi:hypothetical protein
VLFGNFFGNSSLTNFTVDPENPFLSSRDGVLFNKSQQTLLKHPEGRQGTYIVPAGVTSIGSLAFLGCTGLTNIAMPASVTEILEAAFEGCTGLTRIAIPDSVTNIEGAAFYACSSLMEVTIPGTVNIVDAWTFSDCTSLTNIAMPAGVTEILDGAFEKCTGLTRIAIPASVTNIGPDAFSGCSSLMEVTIPGTVNIVGDWTFSDCTSLTKVTLPDRVSTIGQGAFSGCKNLTNITIPASVTNIGLSTLHPVFYGCTDLKSLYFAGDAPTGEQFVFGPMFGRTTSTTVYYLPGATGWGSTFAGRPAVLWNPLIQVDVTSFAGRVSGFGFNIAGTPDIPLVVEGSTPQR